MNYTCLYLVNSAGSYQTWACLVDGYRHLQYVTFCITPFTDPVVVTYTPDYGIARRAADFLKDYDDAFRSWRPVDHNFYRKGFYNSWVIDPNETDLDRYFYGPVSDRSAPEVTYRKEFMNPPDYSDLDEFEYDPAFYGGA